MSKAVSLLTTPKVVAAIPYDLKKALARIDSSKTPDELRPLQADLDALESAMEATGRFTPDQIREANEARMRAIWKLGQLLERIERQSQGGRPGKTVQRRTVFKDVLEALNPPLPKQDAQRFQRIGTLPVKILEKVFAQANKRKRGEQRVTMFELLSASRPFWKIRERQRKHRNIKSAATESVRESFGPFPIIYADPPWSFATFTPSGGGRSPEQHYPTMSTEEIMAFEIDGVAMSDIAHETAALFLWCTSSNIDVALDVMAAWGFEFKTSAAWVKDKQGTGLIFRNWHEVILYGSRGDMPGPVYVPPSVFNYPRGKHSEKPPEIRSEIERMYPDYDASTRLELFSRDNAPGWTHFGYEAKPSEVVAAE